MAAPHLDPSALTPSHDVLRRRPCQRDLLWSVSIVALLLLSVATVSAHADPPIRFENVTEAMGLAEHLERWQMGHGETRTCDIVVTWQGREVTLSNVAVNQYLTIPVGDE